jgi:2'-5' RNA ligase
MLAGVPPAKWLDTLWDHMDAVVGATMPVLTGTPGAAPSVTELRRVAVRLRDVGAAADACAAAPECPPGLQHEFRQLGTRACVGLALVLLQHGDVAVRVEGVSFMVHAAWRGSTLARCEVAVWHLWGTMAPCVPWDVEAGLQALTALVRTRALRHMAGQLARWALSQRGAFSDGATLRYAAGHLVRAALAGDVDASRQLAYALCGAPDVITRLRAAPWLKFVFDLGVDDAAVQLGVLLSALAPGTSMFGATASQWVHHAATRPRGTVRATTWVVLGDAFFLRNTSYPGVTRNPAAAVWCYMQADVLDVARRRIALVLVTQLQPWTREGILEEVRPRTMPVKGEPKALLCADVEVPPGLSPEDAEPDVLPGVLVRELTAPLEAHPHDLALQAALVQCYLARGSPAGPAFMPPGTPQPQPRGPDTSTRLTDPGFLATLRAPAGWSSSSCADAPPDALYSIVTTPHAAAGPAMTTALCVLPPETTWAPLQAVREAHDKSHARWPPHINLVYPFVRPEALDDAVARVADAVAAVSPFGVLLAPGPRIFDHGTKTVTVWVAPKDDAAGTAWAGLHGALASAFPECASGARDVFVPHLTLGQCSKAAYSQTTKAGVPTAPVRRAVEALPPVAFSVTHVCILARSETDPTAPFSVVARVPLGTGVAAATAM